MDILLAFLFSLFLGTICILGGSLFSSGFKPTILHYLVCLVICMISCICLVVIFKMNKAIKTVTNIQLTANEWIVNSSNTLSIAGDVLNMDQLNELSAEALKEQLAKQTPVLSGFISTKSIEEIVKSSTQKVEEIKGSTLQRKTIEVITSTVDLAGSKIKGKIKSYRNTVIIVLVVSQLIAFVFVGYSASKSGKNRNSGGGSYSDDDPSFDYDYDYS